MDNVYTASNFKDELFDLYFNPEKRKEQNERVFNNKKQILAEMYGLGTIQYNEAVKQMQYDIDNFGKIIW